MIAALPTATPLNIGPERVVYENAYQQIYQVRLEFPGFTKEIFVNDHGTRVGVLFIQNDHVLLVRQYRYLTRALAWEIPGGKIEPGEGTEDGARREALEETGLRGLELTPLVFFMPGLDTCHNPTHVFLCTRFETTANAAHDPHEIAGYEWLPLCECLDMIPERQIMDSMTITALLAYQAITLPSCLPLPPSP